MILVGFVCVLGAIGLLIAGLAQANPELVWASIAASAAGGLAVVAAAVQRARALRRAELAVGGAHEASDTTAVKSPAVSKFSAAKRSGGAAIEPDGRPSPDRAASTDVAKGADATAALDDNAETAETDAADKTPETDAADELDEAGETDHAAGADGDEDTDTVESADPVDEPAEEDPDMADLLIVIDLVESVFVVDLRPRYHLERCAHLRNRQAIPIPVNEAREDGFTPCSVCRPDVALATAARKLK